MVFGLVFTALGIGAKAMAAKEAAEGQQAQAEFNASVARYNKKIAKQDKRDIELQGRAAIYNQRRQIARTLSTARASVAGSGIVVDEAGTTPQYLIQDLMEAGEMDIMRLRNNIRREKRKAKIRVQQAKMQQSGYEAQAASINPGRSAFTAALGGIASNADILAAPFSGLWGS